MTTYQQVSTVTGPLGKQRNGVAAVLLSIITLGIYWHVYIFKTHRELKRHTGTGLSAGLALGLSIFLGILSPLLLANEVGSVRRAAGMPERVDGSTGFWTWLPLIGVFIFAVKVQSALNDYWIAEGAPAR